MAGSAKMTANRSRVFQYNSLYNVCRTVERCGNNGLVLRRMRTEFSGSRNFRPATTFSRRDQAVTRYLPPPNSHNAGRKAFPPYFTQAVPISLLPHQFPSFLADESKS